VSLGIVVIKLLRGKVVYLHVNKEREFWCSPGIRLFRPNGGVTLAAAERIIYNKLNIKFKKGNKEITILL
jgi:hypothetical protein